MADPPVLAGASQATVRVLPSGVIRLIIGTSGVVLGVAENAEDQGPSPALVAPWCAQLRRASRCGCGVPA